MYGKPTRVASCRALGLGKRRDLYSFTQISINFYLFLIELITWKSIANNKILLIDSWSLQKVETSNPFYSLGITSHPAY